MKELVSTVAYVKYFAQKNAIELTKFAHKINDSCVSCGLCAKNCPVKAISKKSSGVMSSEK